MVGVTIVAFSSVFTLTHCHNVLVCVSLQCFLFPSVYRSSSLVFIISFKYIVEGVTEDVMFYTFLQNYLKLPN